MDFDSLGLMVLDFNSLAAIYFTFHLGTYHFCFGSGYFCSTVVLHDFVFLPHYFMCTPDPPPPKKLLCFLVLSFYKAIMK